MEGRRPYLTFLLVLASVAVAVMSGSEMTPSYPPYIWGRPIAPGHGRAMEQAPPSAPEWGEPTGQLSLTSEFEARPYGDSCISGLSQQNLDVEAGRVARSRVEGTFFWARFRPDDKASFFFEMEFHEEGADWTAWLVHHGYSPPLQSSFPVYIEQGCLMIGSAEDFMQDLESAGVFQIPYETPGIDGDQSVIAYIRRGDQEHFVNCLPISANEQRSGAELLKVVEEGLISNVEGELRGRLGGTPQGSWFFDNGTWPGERASLRREIESVRSGFGEVR